MVESKEIETEKKVSELAFHLGCVMGILGRDDIQKYFDDYGFAYCDQEKLKDLLYKMSDVFYKER